MADVKTELSALKAEQKELRNSYWETRAVDRPPILTRINAIQKQIAKLQEPPPKPPHRTEQVLLRLTPDEKARLSRAAKRSDTTASDLCRSGGLLNADLILNVK